MRAGDVVRYWTTGGAGRGLPHERDRDLVRADMLDERISREVAREIYGLKIDSTDGGR
jgi:N-methylhydantoinase B